MKNAMTSAKRIPAIWTTIESDARAMSRFAFIARFVAHQTRTEKGRALSHGLQVVETDGGWLYGFTSIGPSCAAPLDEAKLYDAIRRTDLGHYVREAEDYRAYVHAA